MFDFFQFLSLFFDVEDTIEIRTIDPAESCLGRLDDEHLVQFIRNYDGKRNIYFGANPRRDGLTRAARTVDIKHRSAIFFDLDDKDGDHGKTLEFLKTLQPHAIVMTGHGHHVWFRINPERPEKNADRLKQTLVSFRSDSVGDPPRIARMPGTINYKPGRQPVLATSCLQQPRCARSFA